MREARSRRPMGVPTPSDVTLAFSLRRRGSGACSSLPALVCCGRLPPEVATSGNGPRLAGAGRGRAGGVRLLLQGCVWGAAAPSAALERARRELAALRASLQLLPFPCTGVTRSVLRRLPGMSIYEPGSVLRCVGAQRTRVLLGLSAHCSLLEDGLLRTPLMGQQLWECFRCNYRLQK
ncbi:group 10 secretory phospholipase A2 isoform X1 [Strigops habroptila]|uniref:group 10 secretory phospholipase A2 isoform X1 n=1 Tax=Strigops habroptila TaxID=2489341 RepID=UPI0011CF252B|nr:group 10 secretory phospholipase A2 isoform X1 [Strigops habroptila]